MHLQIVGEILMNYLCIMITSRSFQSLRRATVTPSNSNRKQCTEIYTIESGNKFSFNASQHGNLTCSACLLTFSMY